MKKRDLRTRNSYGKIKIKYTSQKKKKNHN